MSSSPPTPEFDPEKLAGRLAPVGAAVAVAGGCVGGWFGWGLALLGLLAVLAACWSRTDGLLVFGPFVRFELIRAARTRRLAFWRFVYAGVAFAILLCLFADPPLNPGRRVTNGDLANRATNFFLLFGGLQFAYLIYLAASLIGPVVAEEREAKRWDFLLVTDLRSREILFGKLAGRLPMLLDPVLASLPILALVTLFGGVSPRMVLAVGLGTLACVAGTAGVAMFNSVIAKTAKAATDTTITLVFFNCCVFGALALFLNSPSTWTFPTSVGIPSPVEFGDLVRVLNAGNPLAVIGFALIDSQTGVDAFEPLFERGVFRLCAFQLGVFLVFSLMAASRLRTATPWLGAPPTTAKRDEPTDAGPKPQTDTEPEPTAKAERPRRWRWRKAKLPPVVERPPVGEWPVYWWERFGGKTGQALAEQKSQSLRAYARFGLIVVVVLLLARVTCPLVDLWYGSDGFLLVIRGLANVGLGFIALGLMVAPTVIASMTVAKERAADTLDALRLTALESRDILFQKWVGVMATIQAGYFVLLTLTLALIVTGFASPLAVVGMGLVVPVYACVAGFIGLYFSVRAANPANAGRNMMLIVVPGVVAMISVFTGVLGAQPFALTFSVPPLASGVFLLFGHEDGPPTDRLWPMLLGVPFGMLFYAGIGWLAWRGAVRRFERERHN